MNVDPSKLDVGNYPTNPQHMDRPAGRDQARQLAGERLADHLALPADVDPRFIYQLPGRPVPPTDYSLGLDPEKQNIVAGFEEIAYSAADCAVGIALTTYVLVMASEQDTSAAVDLLAASKPDAAYDGSATQLPVDQLPVNLPHHPQVRAWAGPHTALRAAATDGRLLIVTKVVDEALTELGEPQDLDALATLAGKNIDAQLAALHGYSLPTADSTIEAPADPDDMLSRALPIVDTSGPTGLELYNDHGALLATPFPVAEGDLFRETGTDRVAHAGTDVLRARDVAAAQRLRDSNFQLFRGRAEYSPPEKIFVSADPPPGVPGARCLMTKSWDKVTSPRFLCAVSRGRYAAQAWSDQLIDAQQQIAAQYVRLAAAE
ncbi:DUF7373 family lipoprotein [Nocardia niigatensis]|uniref:DUF7373 family lipoprotein n=1 Tax=Nocardia niigatensis TaxID=209249 RepID=UPI0003051854|nr:hypothetical protein [Nocardia niigatensis]